MSTAELPLFIDVVAEAGISYRQADYYVRRGWILAPAPGSGVSRRLDPGEATKLCILARLVIAGLTPETAARLAREGADRGRYVLGEGVHIVLTNPKQAVAG